MTSLLIISDTHGNVNAIRSIANLMDKCNILVHLGDHFFDVDSVVKDKNCKVYTVKGNCDLGGNELLITVENVKILLCHGHKYRVKSGLENIYFRAKELQVDAVFYGHTHMADVTEKDGIIFVNPGCMTKFSRKSYCLCEIDDKQINASIKYLS